MQYIREVILNTEEEERCMCVCIYIYIVCNVCTHIKRGKVLVWW
jgi:hypothetical protein